MQGCKSIPTIYKDITMRSRLEAKIAAAIDAYNMPWIYEPEGFNCSGIYYLPDFLVDNSFIIEGKGILDPQSTDKIKAFVCASGFRVIVIDSYGRMDIAYLDYITENSGKEFIYNEGSGMIAKCACCGKWYAADIYQSWACTNCGHSDGDSTFTEFISQKLKLEQMQWRANKCKY